MQPDELKAIRKALGHNQVELGDAIGMSRVTIGLMERGAVPIELRTGLAVRQLAASSAATRKPQIVEAAARSLCRYDGHPENIKFEGKPMWQSYLPEATAAIEAALPHLGIAVD